MSILKQPSLQYVDQLRAAIIHLHKVTGKIGLNHINPMMEKRWSEKCWDCYHTIAAVNHLICDGTDYDLKIEETVQSARQSGRWKQLNANWEPKR